MASRFETEGAAHHSGAALSILPDLLSLAGSLPQERAGIRLHGNPALRAILASDAIRNVLAHHDGTTAYRPVRAILFDKSPATNWSLGWHQDRTIVVRARDDMPGYGPWSRKAGLQHVEPPFALIEAMLTLRIHLDDVPADNAPLRVAPGSHRLGRLPEQEIETVVRRCGIRSCLATAGDVWVYATAIVHASATAKRHAHHRVLQVDFASVDLPPPLAWLGV
ncbi:phytanoyl-CoA dioxygenase family protein [Sphingomonas jeddahensis]|uniref:phytanoyl-CoA dioxygenase family protein n=1 Tax=Sphingomonas jeddahensis TaxID=1915074 RepID=UPI0009768713|nr:phytanoyl-CoA dioxygenase family protein [Sphingomonas jeddahensis]